MPIVSLPVSRTRQFKKYSLKRTGSEVTELGRKVWSLKTELLHSKLHWERLYNPGEIASFLLLFAKLFAVCLFSWVLFVLFCFCSVGIEPRAWHCWASALHLAWCPQTPASLIFKNLSLHSPWKSTEALISSKEQMDDPRIIRTCLEHRKRST